MRVESADIEKLTFTLTVAEDLDCSGLPVCDEQICTYEEGFLSGVLSEHKGSVGASLNTDDSRYLWTSGAWFQ